MLTASRFIFSILALGMCMPSTVWADPPQGFEAVYQNNGIEVFKKSYETNEPDYVFSVDLLQAQIRHSLGPQKSGGDSPTFKRWSLSTHWSNAKAAWPQTVAVLNGQFFSSSTDPAALAFAVKEGGELVSLGYGTGTEFSGLIKLLQWNNIEGLASLDPFAKDILNGPDGAPEMLAGLDVKADKSPGADTGRTFVGITDNDGDGAPETVLFFVSKSATQNKAAATLAGFGAQQQMMLDGGKSSQVILNGNSVVASSRKIPHALVLIAEKAKPIGPSAYDQDEDGYLAEDDCDDQNPQIHPDALELCDGVDNNCDLSVDEGFDLAAPCAVGMGECLSEGIVVCSSLSKSACDAAPKAAKEELCDFLDNDCDGAIDEDFELGEYCENSDGGCISSGVMVCHPASGQALCTAQPVTPKEEVCNGVDDDCDGDVDEGFSVAGSCALGEGACRVDGFMACDSRGGVYCKAPEPKGEAERCDGMDNDCDGRVDEGFAVGEPCVAELSECNVSGELVCSATGLALDCAPLVSRCDPIDEASTGGTEGGGNTGSPDPRVLDVGGDQDSGCSAAPVSNGSPAGASLILVLAFGVLRRKRVA